MALTANITLQRRGPVPKGGAYGYPVAPGEKIFTGGLVCVNSSFQLVRLQTSGALTFVGVAQSGYDNSASATPGPNIVAAMDTFALTVPSATAANINAKVYATDDNTPTLSVPGSGFAGIIGYLEGFDVSIGNQTFVAVKGH